MADHEALFRFQAEIALRRGLDPKDLARARERFTAARRRGGRIDLAAAIAAVAGLEPTELDRLRRSALEAALRDEPARRPVRSDRRRAVLGSLAVAGTALALLVVALPRGTSGPVEAAPALASIRPAAARFDAATAGTAPRAIEAKRTGRAEVGRRTVARARPRLASVAAPVRPVVPPADVEVDPSRLMAWILALSEADFARLLGSDALERYLASVLEHPDDADRAHETQTFLARFSDRVRQTRS